jgi:hypothetical protein
MKKRNVFKCFWFFLLIVCSLPVRAQVVIGSEKIPEKFSVLELISTTRGLRYPQLTTSQRNALNPASNPLAGGLMIFNTDDAGNLEYYAGNVWTVVYTPFVVRSIRQSGVDQGVSITGRNLIPVQGNESAINTETYQVVFPGTLLSGISKLKVGKYLDFNHVVQSVELDNPLLVTGNNAFKVTFRQRAIDLLKESDDPLRFTLYATYDDNGAAKEVDFEVTLKKN